MKKESSSYQSKSITPAITFSEHQEAVNSVAFSPDGFLVGSASVDTTAMIWNVEERKLQNKQRLSFNGEFKAVTSVSFSPKGGQMLLGHHANTGHVVNLPDLDPRLELKGHNGWIPVATFSHDGTKIGTASLDLTGRIWDAKTGESLTVLEGHEKQTDETLIPDGVWSIAFAPDNESVATAGSDKTVRIWDVETGNQKKVLKGSESLVFSVAYSPDGKTIASSDADGAIHLWHAETGLKRDVLKEHSESVVCIAFSPDGKKLASACYDATVKVWDTETNRLILILEGHIGKVHYIAFSPDNKLLASGGEDKTIRIWELDV